MNIDVQAKIHNQASNTCVSLFHSFAAGNSNRRGTEPLYQQTVTSRGTVCSSSSSDETDSIRKPPLYHVEREQRRDPVPRPAARDALESQYETGYTTGDTGNELDRDHTDYLYRWATTLLPRLFTGIQLKGFYFSGFH